MQSRDRETAMDSIGIELSRRFVILEKTAVLEFRDIERYIIVKNFYCYFIKNNYLRLIIN